MNQLLRSIEMAAQERLRVSIMRRLQATSSAPADRRTMRASQAGSRARDSNDRFARASRAAFRLPRVVHSPSQFKGEPKIFRKKDSQNHTVRREVVGATGLEPVTSTV